MFAEVAILVTDRQWTDSSIPGVPVEFHSRSSIPGVLSILRFASLRFLPFNCFAPHAPHASAPHKAYEACIHLSSTFQGSVKGHKAMCLMHIINQTN